MSLSHSFNLLYWEHIPGFRVSPFPPRGKALVSQSSQTSPDLHLPSRAPTKAGQPSFLSFHRPFPGVGMPSVTKIQHTEHGCRNSRKNHKHPRLTLFSHEQDFAVVSAKHYRKAFGNPEMCVLCFKWKNYKDL